MREQNEVTHNPSIIIQFSEGENTSPVTTLCVLDLAKMACGVSDSLHDCIPMPLYQFQCFSS
jgi:hypothetical protein